MKDQHIKEIKLQAQHRISSLGNTTIIPVLKLEGNLLDEYGFHYGETVIVTYSRNKLVITPKRSHEEYRDSIIAYNMENPHLQKPIKGE